MLKKAKIYTIAGVTLLVHAITCFVVFCVTYREKKSLGGAFFALFVAFAAAGAASITLADEGYRKKVLSTRKRIRNNDHWFHNFEFPPCASPKLTIDNTYFPKVETEDE